MYSCKTLTELFVILSLIRMIYSIFWTSNIYPAHLCVKSHPVYRAGANEMTTGCRNNKSELRNDVMM